MSSATIDKTLAILCGETLVFIISFQDIMDFGFLTFKVIWMAAIGAIVPLIIRYIWSKSKWGKKSGKV